MRPSPLAFLQKSAQIACLLVLVGACTRHPPAIDGPARGAGPGYSWPEDSIEAMPTRFETGHAYAVTGHTLREPETAYPATLPFLTTGTPAPTAPITETGTDCFRALRKSGVSFRELPELKGVQAPVEVRGALGGVVYWTSGGSPLWMDCRLALALSRIGSVLSRHGVSRVRYSGAYVYKTAPSGRLSHHAYGLAIDLHEFSMRGASLSVDRAFSRNVGCRKGVPALNRLACELRATSYFDEFLTPDYNAAHRDHLHVSIPSPAVRRAHSSRRR